jgi:hypothetical protein
MPKSLSFRVDYNYKARELRTEVILFAVSAPSPNKTATVSAIWDTGATASVITPDIAQYLQLFPIDTVPIIGVNNEKPEPKPVSIVHIALPNNVLLQTRRVSVVTIAGADMLIGMDIISLGDFLICNAGDKTSFSFVIPPFTNKPDWIEMSNKLNSSLSG